MASRLPVSGNLAVFRGCSLSSVVLSASTVTLKSDCFVCLAELQRHGQLVDAHCEEALDVLTSCRERLQELQTSISRKNREFTVALSRMEDDVLTADSSQR